MEKSIPVEFVDSWGSVRECKRKDLGMRKEYCDGSRLTETMVLFNGASLYCMTCYEYFSEASRKMSVPKINDAKFKCPWKNCDAKLFFRDFLAGNCCKKSSSQNQRTEFQDLKKMMDLLEQSEKEENDAKEIMDLKDQILDSATIVYNNKKIAREKSRASFASSLTYAGVYVSEDNERTEKTKMQELRDIMDKHDTAIKDEEDSHKKMEEDKEALGKATADFMKKKEKREQVQSDLSSSFTDAGKDLVVDEQEKENQWDKCNVCFEKYNKLDRFSCAPKCGHLTCKKCLNELPEKLCPICREPFTENDTIKIYLK